MDKEAQLQQLLRTASRQNPPEGYPDEFLDRLRARLREEPVPSPAFSFSQWLTSVAAGFRRPALAWPVGLATAAFAAGFFLREAPSVPSSAPDAVALPAAPSAGAARPGPGAVAIPVGFSSEAPAPVPVDQTGPAGVPPSDVPGKRRTVSQPENR